MTFEVITERIRILLTGELPGEKAHNLMIPEVRKKIEIPEQNREAAVMILLYPDRDSVNIVLIKRAEYDGAHSGQISFPGGMKEESDPDLMTTAIREIAEETGLIPTRIRMLGKLSPICIPVSAFQVQPFVACYDKTPEFNPDPVEVDFLITIPLVHLLDKGNRKKEKWNLSGIRTEVPFFEYNNFKIWGATAMIMSEFIEIIEEAGPDL